MPLIRLPLFSATSLRPIFACGNRGRSLSLSVACGYLLVACASNPAPAPPPSATVASPSACAQQVCPACVVCPAPAEVPDLIQIPEPPPGESPRGRLEPTNWNFLPAFENDDAKLAIGAFVKGCAVLQNRAEWRDACTQAAALTSAGKDVVLAYLRSAFTPYRVLNLDETDQGIVTGYYEPQLRGSRTRTNTFRYPVYAAPNDLVTVDLTDLHPDLKHRRLRGRLIGNKLVPYYDRADIEANPALLKGLEIAWVDSAVELFFLQIQGSGQIVFADGARLRVGYADQNGHPFRSTAGALIRSGQLRASQASMQGIKAWAAANPMRVQRYLNLNPSYVFFKELPADLSGPIGTLGVPLTAERSIAIDPRVVPLGAPVFLSTTLPGSKQALNRLVVAQDTGGAIAGGVRVDYFWGFGDEAGLTAGKMKQLGRMWTLLPNGYVLDADRKPPK